MKAGFDLDLKQPKVNGRARRGLCSPEPLMKRSECECQTGGCPNTSVIIVTPSLHVSGPDWSHVSICFLVWSRPVHAALIPRYTSFTPTCSSWAAQFSLSAFWMTMPLHTGYMLTNDGPLNGLGFAAELRAEKWYLTTQFYCKGSAKVVMVPEEPNVVIPNVCLSRQHRKRFDWWQITNLIMK